MPGRLIPLVNDECYHVFNRGIDHRPTFTDIKEFKRALMVIEFYRFLHPPMKLSKFLQQPIEKRNNLLKLRETSEKSVEVLAFCLMPNHFHFLVRQIQTNGISKFLANFQNSYTKYFNTKNERSGPLFLNQFKAVHIDTEDQLLHVSRYIHLNPLTSFVIKDFKSLLQYPWSSLNEYLYNKALICDAAPVLNFFNSPNDYQKFIEDQAAYQRERHKIMHLLIE